MLWSLLTYAPGNVLVLAVLIPFLHQDVVNLVVMCSIWAVPSTFWMAYGCLGCLPAQGCCRLQRLLYGKKTKIIFLSMISKLVDAVNQMSTGSIMNIEGQSH